MTDESSHNTPNAQDANSPSPSHAQRIQSLAQMQAFSEDSRFQIGAAPALTSDMTLVTPNKPESDRWRRLIEAAVNPLTTELWNLYQEDCRMRGTLEQPYEVFTQLAATLTSPELPTYWELYLADCDANEREVEPFLTFMRRMQTTLDRERGAVPGR